MRTSDSVEVSRVEGGAQCGMPCVDDGICVHGGRGGMEARVDMNWFDLQFIRYLVG